MGLLDRAGARLTARPEEAEILVVNTCSFIDTAKQESVDTILEMARHKTAGSAKKLIVAGCLVERYRDEIRKNIPEVDAVVGTGELESILEAAGIAPARCRCAFALQHPDQRAGRCALRPGVAGAGTHKAAIRIRPDDSPKSRAEGDARERQGRFSREEWQGAAHLLPTYLYDENTPRLLSTPRASAYIKIAEGCDHPCSFLRHSQPARQVPLAALRVGGGRGAATGRARSGGDYAHRPGHDLLRRRPGPERRPGHAAR